MEIEIEYTDEWELREKKDVHPSHRESVIRTKEILECIEREAEKGNYHVKEMGNGKKAFSPAIFISELKKEIQKRK